MVGRGEGNNGNPYAKNLGRRSGLATTLIGSMAALAACSGNGVANAANTATASASASGSGESASATFERANSDFGKFVAACGKVVSLGMGKRVEPSGASPDFTYNGWAATVNGEDVHRKCAYSGNTVYADESASPASALIARVAGTAEDPTKFRVSVVTAAGVKDSAVIDTTATSADDLKAVQQAEAVFSGLMPADAKP